ncbi:MAG TPA: AmmeMemoRadiSam system protein A, partial [Povalibacter sp.]|nr:AmmeMemoRadiSam system protein A [Povalibacter sp.]
MTFDPVQRHELLRLARQSISTGLRERRRTDCPPASVSRGLDVLRASFVTLRIDTVLRGCCGSIDVQRSVAEDVWRNAWSSAFSDPRFAPLTTDEYPRCDVHVSVLSELEPVPVHTEAELLQVLRPQIDGLLLRFG